MNIPIVQGSFFTERNDSCRQVIIDERGAETVSYTHLHEATELKPSVNKMREDHFPLKEMKNMGIELNYDFTVLSDCLLYTSRCV